MEASGGREVASSGRCWPSAHRGKLSKLALDPRGGDYVTPEIPLDESATDGISRRRALKRIGAGVAVVWTVPIMTSLRTPAFAQSVSCSDTGCPGDDGLPCTGNPPGCPDGDCYLSPCFKIEDTEGNCRCVQNAFLSCLSPCSNSSDCAPGQFCVPPSGLCADCCGVNCHSGASRKVGRSGRTLLSP